MRKFLLTRSDNLLLSNCQEQDTCYSCIGKKSPKHNNFLFMSSDHNQLKLKELSHYLWCPWWCNVVIHIDFWIMVFLVFLFDFVNLTCIDVNVLCFFYHFQNTMFLTLTLKLCKIYYTHAYCLKTHEKIDPHVALSK